MATREILTLQVGSYSNFVGSHWWNLQDATFIYDEAEAHKVEVNHGILFRQGLKDKGQITYTPRLISVDLKGSIGPLIDDERRKELKAHPLTWQGDVVVHQREAISTYHLQNVLHSKEIDKHIVSWEKEVKYWTDYLKPELHSRSTFLLPNVQHGNKQIPFDYFPEGTTSWKEEETQDELENRVRLYVEECGNLQGFHVLLDMHNGFSGLASSLMEHLKDEYPAKCTFAFPVLPAHGDYNINKMSRLLNTSLSLSTLFELSSILCPLSLDSTWASKRFRGFKYLQYKPELAYHTGAILATALDTATLGLRKKSGLPVTLTNLEHSLVQLGHKAVSLSCAVPFSLTGSSNEFLSSVVSELVPLSPCIDKLSDIWSQYFIWRGVPDPSRLQSMVDPWSSQQWSGSATTNTLFKSQCPGKLPYPQYFTAIDSTTDLCNHETAKGMEAFSTIAGFHSLPSMGGAIRQLHSEISKIHVKRFHHCGIEEDDLMENRNHLMELAHCYEDTFDM